jgi:hypothetical protein
MMVAYEKRLRRRWTYLTGNNHALGDDDSELALVVLCGGHGPSPFEIEVVADGA